MYSFGVVVLEIVSGRKSVDVKAEAANQYLLEWVTLDSLNAVLIIAKFQF